MLSQHSQGAASLGGMTPVINLWDRLLVPLQGEIGDQELQDIIDNVLRRIAEHGAEGLVIDASGIWLVDSHLCAGLSRLAMSASSMGVRSVLCGLSAEVVMTLGSMGFDLTEVNTAMSLEQALQSLGLSAKRQPRHEGERR